MQARFALVVLPHRDAAYNLARWMTRDPTLAQDVVQDALVRALARFATFRDGNARAWLLQIVRRVAFDVLRARTSPEELDPDMPDPAPDPEAALARLQGTETVDRALAALPLHLRECLVLRELEELSYREIATVLEVPVGTVMSRLWRARQALLGNAS